MIIKSYFRPQVASSALLKRYITSMSTIEKGKEAAAIACVNENIKDGQIVGIGSGSTIVYAVGRIAERVQSEGLKLVCVPTSFQSVQLIQEHKLTLSDLNTHYKLDVAIDGADEVDSKLNLIKGGGAAQTQEKCVAAAAEKFYVIADFRKDSSVLGENWLKGIPLEVLPFSYKSVQYKIESQLGGRAELRLATQKAGPVITDNGNFILDWKFSSPAENWNLINENLKQIPGIIETGLFCGMTDKVYFGLQDGSVKIR